MGVAERRWKIVVRPAVSFQKNAGGIARWAFLLADRYAENLDDTAPKFTHSQPMQVLIDDLLIDSRIGRDSEPEEIIDLNTVVDDVCRNLSAAIQKSGAVLVVDELPKMSGYRPEMIRLVQNLIENSIKFRSDAPLRIEVGFARDSDGIIVSVFRFTIPDEK